MPPAPESSAGSRRSPKRGPQGKCAACGAAIPTKQKRCAVCAAKAEEAKRRLAENIQVYRTPSGEVRELPVQKAWAWGYMVFEPHSHGGRRFAHSDTCGEFLDALLGVIFARPVYIRPDDIHRYAAWLDAFRSHVIDHPWGLRRGSRFPVTTIPLRDLTYALRDWVDRVVRANEHPLFPTYAIDVAQFIVGHAYGCSGNGTDHWRITGLTAPDAADTGGQARLTESRLKHEVTSRLKGTLVRCAIPLGGHIPGPTGAPPLLEPGERFVFEVERCHLSQENYYDRPCARAIEGDRPRYDIAENLRFRGAIILDHTTARPITCLTSQPDSSWRWSHREAPAEIPVRWITDVYEWPDRSDVPQPIPLPRWVA